MLILELVVNALARAKLDARQISRRDAEQVIANGPLVIENPHARIGGSVFVIGHTDALRFITLVLQPDHARTTRWHVMTGWGRPHDRSWSSNATAEGG